jgi:hypothetical protein
MQLDGVGRYFDVMGTILGTVWRGGGRPEPLPSPGLKNPLPLNTQWGKMSILLDTGGMKYENIKA